MLNIKNNVGSIRNYISSHPRLRRGLFVGFIYLMFIAIYIGLQEFYISNCTYRGGFINLFVSMPVCVYANRALEVIGNQFISSVLLLSCSLLTLMK
jgi:hypothetical protein